MSCSGFVWLAILLIRVANNRKRSDSKRQVRVFELDLRRTDMIQPIYNAFERFVRNVTLSLVALVFNSFEVSFLFREPFFDQSVELFRADGFDVSEE